MESWFKKEVVRRVAIILLGLMTFSSGLAPLLRGRFFYLGMKYPSAGPVFAPIAIVIGLFLIYIAVFRWEQVKRAGSGRMKKT